MLNTKGKDIHCTSYAEVTGLRFWGAVLPLFLYQKVSRISGTNSMTARRILGDRSSTFQKEINTSTTGKLNRGQFGKNLSVVIWSSW